MLQASVEKITLQFKNPAGTSRGVLHAKNSWIIKVSNKDFPENQGIGEASIIDSLSPEWNEDYEKHLHSFLENINSLNIESLKEFPSIQFAIECARLDLENGGKGIYFPSDFTENKEGILINGLIWMGAEEFMLKQIEQKIDQGFSCIKLKIGAIDFESELRLLKFIRDRFSKHVVELRVDANGAFSNEEALSKLSSLSQFDIHSIEQPIRQNQWNEMASLVKNTPIPIALDEELIGVHSFEAKSKLISTIQPQYIILKPSLNGGFASSDEWIDLAENNNVGWWVTSALESNVGLNAIAQYVATKKSPMPQGLGTGQLFSNNTSSSLTIKGEKLFYS